MFEQQDKNKRKWECFVCGEQHTEYEEFKSHVIEKHDEGREYLLCPQCNTPVRDMKLHYKVKHPNRILPNNIQTRVAVWKDFKTGKNGKKEAKKTRKPSFRQGTFVSAKSGSNIPYRSGMECDFLECLESDLDVSHYKYEAMKIPYFHQGQWHDYIPDLVIKYVDGSVEVWEIKPANQTSYEKNKSKWSAANQYCNNIGYGFVVQTEVGLGKLKNKIKKQQTRHLMENIDDFEIDLE